jgi:hypothetical protein
VFEALGDTPLDLDALTARITVPRRTARICTDAMVALGLLERDGPLYRNSPAAGAFLTGRGPRDLRPFLRSMDRTYPVWAEFTEAIRSGQGPGYITRLDPEAQRIYSAGVESASAGAARALAGSYEFGQHRRLLDLGRGNRLVPGPHPRTSPCHRVRAVRPSVSGRPGQGKPRSATATREGARPDPLPGNRG